MGGVFPDRASAAAKAHDAESVGIAALRLGPRRCGVEVGEKLGIRLAVDDRHEFRHLGDLGEIFALAEIIVRRNRERAELAKSPRDVPDVFVQSENLHCDHDHGRILHIGGTGIVDRHFAIGDLDLGLTGRQAVRVGLDGVGADWPRGERIARRGRGRGGEEEAAPRQRIDLVCQAFQIGHQFRLSRHTNLPVLR